MVGRAAAIEALTGAHVGRVLSCEIIANVVPTFFTMAAGNTDGCVPTTDRERLRQRYWIPGATSSHPAPADLSGDAYNSTTRIRPGNRPGSSAMSKCLPEIQDHQRKCRLALTKCPAQAPRSMNPLGLVGYHGVHSREAQNMLRAVAAALRSVVRSFARSLTVLSMPSHGWPGFCSAVTRPDVPPSLVPWTLAELQRAQRRLAA